MLGLILGRSVLRPRYEGVAGCPSQIKEVHPFDFIELQWIVSRYTLMFLVLLLSQANWASCWVWGVAVQEAQRCFIRLPGEAGPIVGVPPRLTASRRRPTRLPLRGVRRETGRGQSARTAWRFQRDQGRDAER